MIPVDRRGRLCPTFVMAAKAATHDNSQLGKLMAAGIFICYRRDDSSDAAGRLYHPFKDRFGPERVFMDVDAIEPGVDFVKVVTERVGNCAVLVAVIGPKWLDIRDEHGRRRLDQPEDLVRVEIQTALSRDVRVIPLLVNNAMMPREADLPEPLRPFARRNAFTVTHATFGRDMSALMRVVEKDVRPKGWFNSIVSAFLSIVTPTFVVKPKDPRLLSKSLTATLAKLSDGDRVGVSTVISVLKEVGGPLRNNEIASLMGVRNPEASKRVSHAVAAGLVSREVVGREVRITLTEKGRVISVSNQRSFFP